ncbi:glycoside hydrolase family 5 protein Ecym_3088 [Eremothecium cymbalariae DBVPG|uniref:glucan 1,3-beta-glucosidase n=1 Tax=Eremothecium cymbalariae (strain CBS 270.75 / DBVPG 7215 / KCTC 17166 / NRRL Y-17582) TaxID=931890 RepID=G8JR29_ERECY|nr:Hypothetical protein Ecym_3088 [Eremothecium cymbalariae DBVPG\
MRVRLNGGRGFCGGLLVLVSVLGMLVENVVVSTPVGAGSRNGMQFITNKKRYYDYEGSLVRGVNIGGWLLLEPYITPSIFETFRTNEENDDGIPVDEYHFCSYLGQEVARDRLVAHWETFYKEEDFHNIAAAGLNLVRIPIGYWAFETLDSDPYVSGYQEGYLDQAIEWARRAGLKVWVDLHGAPGSQNGFDNSGLRGQVQFLEGENFELLKRVVRYVMEKYSRDYYSDVVIGVQVLNEPLGTAVDMGKVKELYYYAYDTLRNEMGRDQIMVIHDAFMAPHYWDDQFTLEGGYWGVLVDHHHYQVFSPGEVSRSMDEHLQVACALSIDKVTEGHWNVVGEWSAALTDCAKWLNGVGVGYRWDGTYSPGSTAFGSCEHNDDISRWSPERVANTRRYVEAQLDAFEVRGGWIFWCYKTESAIEWDLQRLLYYNLFPQPLSDRHYPNQCSNY